MSSSSTVSNNYCSILKLCSSLNQAKSVHCHIIKTIPNPETFLFNNIVNTYNKLGNSLYARKVFDTIPRPNLFSWNTLLSTFSTNPKEMEEVFDSIPRKDAVSWNLVISSYSKCGLYGKAVEVYRRMMRGGGFRDVNRITLSTMILLSMNMGCVFFGRQIHGQVVKFGFGGYVFVGSPLIDMYSKGGMILDARRVFEGLSEKNVVMYNTMIMGLLRSGMVDDARELFCCMPDKDSISWTSMITGFTQNGMEREAIDVFRQMRFVGLAIDQFTFGSILTACGVLLALNEGKQIHGYIIRTDFLDNVFVGSALVDLYSKCRMVKYAENVFKNMRFKNVISWTAMVVGYGQNGYSEEAVRIFCEMQRHGVDPDEFTLGSVISSCANLASLEEGAQFHSQAIISGLISFVTVSNALVTLYGKCGSLEDSRLLFDEMKFKDDVSFTALVCGYARFGKANETIDLFEKMLLHGLKPDGVTFIGVLSACSRAGLVDKGKKYFHSMGEKYGITPFKDHYTCMIDLYSRSGKLEEAKKIILNMPCKPDEIGWATLLSSCRNQGNMEIGKWAADALCELEPHNPASYVLLSSMYAAKGKWDAVANLRKEMRDLGIRKEPGCSWIKYRNKVHIFSADDMSSPYSDQIYAELEKLYEKMLAEGYIQDVSSVLHDVPDTEKTKLLNHHSEKLAIAFGLIFIPRGLPIRVVKNLRVCADCHNATKFISKITQREILVRDSVRYHLFKDGTCSCGDFW